MSYDVNLIVDTGGEPVEIWSRNHTSNTSQMWKEAGLDLLNYQGEKASALGFAAHEASLEIMRNSQKYRSMESPNGWGTVESTFLFLTDIADACTKYPETLVDISY